MGRSTAAAASSSTATASASSSSSSSSRGRGTSASASASSSSASAATGPQTRLEQHLAALGGVRQEAAALREGIAGVGRRQATQQVRAALGTVEAAYAFMEGLVTPEAQEEDEDLAVRVRDAAERRGNLVASVGEVAVAGAVAGAVAAAEGGKSKAGNAQAVVAAVRKALDKAEAEVAGGKETVQELRGTLEAAGGDGKAAVEAIKAEVGAANGGDWAFSGSYRPFEALALLEEMSTWLQHTLQHCGLRDTIAQLQGKAEPLRGARADDYSKGWKHANHIRSMAKALSEEGRVGSKEYKTINAALLFADLKFQSHLMEEKTIKERLAALTEPEAGEAAASKAKGGKSGKGKASTAGGGKDAEEEGEGKEGLVKYLPAAHREAVQALVEAAEGKRGRPPKRGQASGKGKQPAAKPVALKPLCAELLGYAPPSSSSGGNNEGNASATSPSKGPKRPMENPFRTVLHVVDAIAARLSRDCRGGGAGGLKKRKGGAEGEEEVEPYTIKRLKAVNSEQRQRRRWDVAETKRLLRGVVKYWEHGFRWRRIKEWDGNKGDQARLMHRTNLDLCEKARSLLEKWEKEEGEGVDKDAYPEWAEALLKDEDRLLRYCGRE